MAIPGVYAGREALMLGDTCEKSGELTVLGIFQGGADVLLVCQSNLANASHHGLPFGCEGQGVLSPIRCAPHALHKPSCLQFVDEGHDTAGQQ